MIRVLTDCDLLDHEPSSRTGFHEDCAKQVTLHSTTSTCTGSCPIEAGKRRMSHMSTAYELPNLYSELRTGFHHGMSGGGGA